MDAARNIRDKNIDEGPYTSSVSKHIHSEEIYLQSKNHKVNLLLFFTNMKQAKLSIDKITQFLHRSPEFLNIIDMVRS